MDNMIVYLGVLAVLAVLSLFMKNIFKATDQTGMLTMGIKGIVVLIILMFVGYPLTLLFSGQNGRDAFFRPAYYMYKIEHKMQMKEEQEKEEDRQAKRKVLHSQASLAEAMLNKSRELAGKEPDKEPIPMSQMMLRKSRELAGFDLDTGLDPQTGQVPPSATVAVGEAALRKSRVLAGKDPNTGVDPQTRAAAAGTATTATSGAATGP